MPLLNEGFCKQFYFQDLFIGMVNLEQQRKSILRFHSSTLESGGAVPASLRERASILDSQGFLQSGQRYVSKYNILHIHIETKPKKNCICCPLSLFIIIRNQSQMFVEFYFQKFHSTITCAITSSSFRQPKTNSSL